MGRGIDSVRFKSRLRLHVFLITLPVGICLCTAPSSSDVVLTVCPPGSNPPCNYQKIEDAIDSRSYPLSDKVIIKVKPGTYRERVQVRQQSGTASAPLIILADGPAGSVVVDGSDDFDWTNLIPGIWFAYVPYSSPGWNPALSQVFVDSTRYTYVANVPPIELQTPRTWTADPPGAPEWIYINTGGLDPDAQDTGVTNTLSDRQRGFEIFSSDYVTIDGFTVRRCREEGIFADTLHTFIGTSLVVQNCTAAENRRRGIHLEGYTASTIQNNRTRDNGRHGIHAFSSSNCQILRNLSYRNDDPLSAWGGQAGIKVGTGMNKTNATNMTVDYNVVHDNEDSGIDINGATGVLVRRNLSYRNGDHGYDAIDTDQTTFLNNVALRNNHDGISLEDGSTNVKVYNCILAYNALEARTLTTDENVAQLFVDDVTGFASNYNILVGDPPGFLWQNQGGQPRVRTLVQWLSTEYDDLLSYTNATGLDMQSHASYPDFADTLHGNFLITSAGSVGIDDGWADAVGWLPTDPRGFMAHDVYQVDGGDGSPPYGDIGAYEFDALPGAPTIAVSFGYNSVIVSWTARGDDASDPPAPDRHEVLVDGVVKKVNSNPPASGTLVAETASAAPCQSHSVVVRVTDHNGQVALSNTVSGTTCCSFPCGTERPGRTAAVAPRPDVADWPLELAGPHPNPAVAISVVNWSIPHAHAGETYDLSLFDIAGRRVSVVASGTASAGRFGQTLALTSSDGAIVPDGVFFLRLRVGTQVLSRRIVIAR